MKAKVIGAAATLLLACGVAQAVVTIDTVTVGDPGNAADTRYASPGYGSVGYTYNIGKYEVTAGQYCEFLNAVAKTDTYALYTTDMETNPYGCKITRHGTSGNYTYDFSGRPSGTEADWVNRPVTCVNFWDACRFANWLHNGQPTGDQGAGTTECGAYTLGGYTGTDGRTIQRSADAKWAVTSEDEWYKAAYYKGGSTNAGYWSYPTQNDTAPSNVGWDGYTDPGNHANYYDTIHERRTMEGPYYRTNVGEFENSASAYGTFDQAGNVWEWNEAVIFQDSTRAYRGVRGSSFGASSDDLLASYRTIGHRPMYELVDLGFRVTQIPEPASLSLLALGGLAVLRRGSGRVMRLRKR